MDYCSNADFLSLILLIKKVIVLFEIVVPIVLLVMGTIDFGKAVIASKEDEMKKAQKTFTTRLICAVAIFLVPFMVNYLMKMIDSSLRNTKYNIPIITTASRCYTNADSAKIASMK